MSKKPDDLVIEAVDQMVGDLWSMLDELDEFEKDLKGSDYSLDRPRRFLSEAVSHFESWQQEVK